MNKIQSIVLKTIEGILVLCAMFFVSIGLFRFVNKKYVYPVKYIETVNEYADAYGIERSLVFSFIKCESNFNEKAVSKKGAMGLMQITLDTGRYIAEKLGIVEYNLFEVENNINFGCYYIKYLIQKFESEHLAICAYNAGEGNVASWLNNRELSIDGKTLSKIPFSETEEYVKKIADTQEKYKNLYGKFLDK